MIGVYRFSLLAIALHAVIGCGSDFPSSSDEVYDGQYTVSKDETGLMASLDLEDGGQDSFDVHWDENDAFTLSGSFLLPTIAPNNDNENLINGQRDGSTFAATGTFHKINQTTGKTINADVRVEGKLLENGKRIRFHLVAKLSGFNEGTIEIDFAGKRSSRGF